MAIVKQCPYCLKYFETYPSINQRCCSRECAFGLQKSETRVRKVRLCKICGKDFIPKHTKSPGLYCSYKCRGVSSRKKLVNRGGYWYVYMPDHPHSNKQGYIPKHHLVYERGQV